MIQPSRARAGAQLVIPERCLRQAFMVKRSGPVSAAHHRHQLPQCELFGHDREDYLGVYNEFFT
jgi:hypothetical protein